MQGVTEHAWSVHGGGHAVELASLGHGYCRPGSCWEAYERTGHVGKGGFGTIHRARPRKGGESFAIKEIRRSALAERELHVHRAAAACTSVVVRIVDYFVEPASVYLVLELCRGPDLNYILETRGAVSEPEARNVMRQLCHAIDHLHRRRIVHRDIKPGNVVLLDALPHAGAPIDSATIKLIDMGLSRLLPLESRTAAKAEAKASSAEVVDNTTSGTGHEDDGCLPSSAAGLSLGLRGKLLADRAHMNSGRHTLAGALLIAEESQSAPGTNATTESQSAAPAADAPTIHGEERSALAEAHAAAKLVSYEGERARVTQLLSELEVSHDRIDVSVCGSRIYAAPELLARVGQVDAATVTLIAAEALALDSFSLGMTLRHMLTGVPPNISVLSYANGRGLLVPLLTGAAIVVQRMWRGLVAHCRRRRKAKAKQQDNTAFDPDSPKTQPANLPDKQWGQYTRNFRYLDQISKSARNLMNALSNKDPHARMTADEARKHEWMVDTFHHCYSSTIRERSMSVPASLHLLGDNPDEGQKALREEEKDISPSISSPTSTDAPTSPMRSSSIVTSLPPIPDSPSIMAMAEDDELPADLLPLPPDVHGSAAHFPCEIVTQSCASAKAQ